MEFCIHRISVCNGMRAFLSKCSLALLFLLLALGNCFAQTVRITGTVRSGSTSEPLVGCNVIIKGTSTGTVTNSLGQYSIEVSSGQDIITFSFVGFVSQEVLIGNRSIIDIELIESTFLLDEFIVIGYGSKYQSDVTSSISSLNDQEINPSVATGNFEQVLQGRVAGLQITNSSGQPGSAVKINLRGATSITASNSPLYVVDGVAMYSENNSALETYGYNFSSLSDINPDDIASIQVLKDAEATAIYGSRGANGVIIIETKSGKQSERNQIGVNVSYGWQSPVGRIDMMNSAEFINLMNEAAANDGLPSDYFSNEVYGNFIGDPLDPNLQNTDWYGEVLRDDAPISNYSLYAIGSHEKVSYYINSGFLNQEGIQRGSSFRRFSFRANLDVDMSDKLTFGTRTFLSRSLTESNIGDVSFYGPMINTLNTDPTMPVRDSMGNYSNPFQYFSYWILENPRAAVDIYHRDTYSNRFLGTAFFNYEIAKNLEFRSSWSADFQYVKDDKYYPANTQASISSGVGGLGLYASNESLTWLNENTLTYKIKVQDKHDIAVLAGYSMQGSSKDISAISGQNYSTNSHGDLADAANITSANNFESSWGLMSFLGRLGYNYESRYYLSATFRTDGSSRFEKSNRFGFFPGVSLGWRVSEEGFYKKLGLTNWMDDFKIRLSYGATGNQTGIGDYASRSLYSLNADYNNAPGIRPHQLGNSQLSWETTSQFNVGTDLSFFHGRVQLVFDYFKKNTKDLLLSSIVSATSGYSTVFRNIGEMENKGLEFTINSVNIRTLGEFNWNTSFNISTIKNKVLKLDQNDQIYDEFVTTHILREGQPIGSFYLIHFEGVDPQTGNSIYTDVNGDGDINADDALIPKKNGKALTNWPDYFGGITNTFSYKNVSLVIFFQYSKGNYLWNHSRHALETVGYSYDFGGFLLPYGNNSKRVDEKRWRNPGDVTDVPRAGVGRKYDSNGNIIAGSEYQNWQEGSDQWLEDASYLRLKNITLSYDLPSTFVQKIMLESVQLYFKGQNLLTFSKYLGLDPEISSNGENMIQQGEDFGGLSQAKSFVFGFRIIL